MPVYEYRCNDCAGEFEYTQRMSDDPKSECETCGGSLERLISRSSFHLKGGGWYKDLYSSPKPQNDSSSSSKGGDGGDAGSSSQESSSGEASGSKDSKGSSSSVATAAN